MFRSVRALALLLCVILAACGDTGSRMLGVAGSGEGATVRLVNATGISLDLATDGVVTTGNRNLAPGTSVGCFQVLDPSAPGLSVRQTGTTADLAGFSPIFTEGGSYTVIAYPGAAGVVQFATLTNGFVLNGGAGTSVLRVFDAAPNLGTVDVYVTAPGAALGTASALSLGNGSTSNFFVASSGANQLRLTTPLTTNVVFDSGTFTLDAGQSYTLIVSGATPSAFLITGC